MELKDKALDIIKFGSDIIGACTGATLGMIGTPIASIGGASLAIFLTKGINEIAERMLSPREKTRVGAAEYLVLLGIRDNLEKGLQIRQDDFFDNYLINRSKAEELFEGIIIKCKNEYEENKIIYISNIYINVAFDSTINPNNVNQILNTVEKLSYRQLTMIALVGQNKENQLLLRKDDYRGELIKINNELEFLLQDFVIVNSYGLIERYDNTKILDVSDIIPGGMTLTSIGETYYNLLELSSLSTDDLDYLINLRD